mmetsp:Transcript_24927/g.78928  ORF Transcript_24927/g.78928 Transcript_24927/m.78928 type:complete len:221 (-) Transcript_24927:217-879(-)
MTGRLWLVKVSNRFLMVSMLSSARPDVSPRLRSRPCMVSRGQSKKSTFLHGITCASKASAWSSARGKPSMRNSFAPLLIMAVLRRPMVTSMGTSLPSFIRVAHMVPISEPEATSSRRRSPAERCLWPYLATMRSHWVPLPEPGPPRTNVMLASEGSSAGAAASFTVSSTVVAAVAAAAVAVAAAAVALASAAAGAAAMSAGGAGGFGTGGGAEGATDTAV